MWADSSFRRRVRRIGRATRTSWMFHAPGRRSREWDRILSQRLEHLVGVAEPLALISQVQRSGGTLLTQLFDGHPEVHAHPFELYVGYPNKQSWPDLSDVRDRRQIYRVLRELPAEDSFRHGYRKYGRGTDAGAASHPFVLPPLLQQQLFAQVAEDGPTDRQAFDAYFTSYFNAWLDNHNLYQRPKRWITGFVPRLAMSPENVSAFFTVYPDGCLISVLRDPASWYASAKGHHESYERIEAAMDAWTRSTRAMIEAQSRWPDAVHLIRFEQLVTEPEPTMRALADRMGLTFDDALLQPTFNGRPITSDSSFATRSYGIQTDAADRRQKLDAQTVRRIDESARALYDEAIARIEASAESSTLARAEVQSPL